MVLLNLCAISLSLNGGEVDITNEEVKSQLLELRNFIDEKRDFTKGAKDLKPVLVQYRSSESTIDGVVQCNMGFNTDELHLSIGGTVVLSNGYKLTININVEYEYTEYVGYTIKTAKLNVISVEDVISLDFTDMTDTEIVDYLQSLGRTNFYAFVKLYEYHNHASFSGFTHVIVGKPDIILINFDNELKYQTGDYGTTKGFKESRAINIPYGPSSLYDETKNQYLTHDTSGNLKWLDITE